MGKSRAIYPRPIKICNTCNKEFEKPLNAGIIHWAKRRFCSKQCQYKDRIGKINEESYAWKKDIGVYGVHCWLYRNFGKADMCENPKCDRKSSFYDWAKKTECKYEKKRENFWKLCRRCHRKYDMTEEIKMKAIKNLHWYRKGAK